MKRNGQGWAQILKHLRESRPLTTFEVSKICGTVHSTVSNWVDEGKLLAYKTPGGHRRVKKEDLILFLKLYNIPIPNELLIDGSFLNAQNSDDNDSDLKQNKILIVEDDHVVLNILFETLKTNFPEFEIRQATDGFEAGKQLAIFQPHLIILDLILPGMDGFRVLDNIRQDKNYSHIKVITISGYDTPENRERILECGGSDGFLSKPIDLNKLKTLVERMLIVPAKK